MPTLKLPTRLGTLRRVRVAAQFEGNWWDINYGKFYVRS